MLHDVTLPGWLDSLDHLVVGPTGVWVVASCRRRRLLRVAVAPCRPGSCAGCAAQATGVAEMLDGWARGPVRSLLCLRGARLGTLATPQGAWLADPRRLANLVRSGSTVAPGDIDQAAARLLKVLRAAA